MKYFATLEELEAGLSDIQQSPSDSGKLEMIVIRPEVNKRKILIEGYLDIDRGLIGDNWITKGSSKIKGGAPHPDMQINIINSRSISHLAKDKNRWQLAGDQLFINMNLSEVNLPVGSKLKIGTALIEITSVPHNGCKKFAERFGIAAVKFVNSPIGKELHLRGVNAKVIRSGKINTGDIVIKK